MGIVDVGRGCSIGLWLLTLLPVAHCVAQESVDSLAIEHRITIAYPGRSFIESARSLMFNDLEAGNVRQASDLLVFMDRRRMSDGTLWLGPAERLLAEVAINDTASLNDRMYLANLLAGTVDPRQRLAFNDRLLERLRELLRKNLIRISTAFDGTDPTPEQRRFFVLLINHLLVVGYRARAEVNDLVDRFAIDFPGTWRADLATRYIMRPYDEADFGAGFSAAYAAGRFDASLADIFSSFHAPVLAGEVYLYRVTIVGMFMIGVANAPASFTAGGRMWKQGEASFISASLDAGYEFRFARLAFTPLAGLAVQSIRSAGDEELESNSLPRTRNRLGLDIGVSVGYRIPFDIGPNIDLRIRFDRTTTALGDYDPVFSGALYSVAIGFALVHRPYRSSLW